MAFLDVLICGYNEADVLPALLESFTCQTAGREIFRIIFIDNCSTDDTKNIIDSYQDKLNILYKYEPRQGKSLALNTGYGLAASKYVAQIDADCIAQPDWIENIIKVINDESPDAIGGPYLPYYNTQKPEWYKDEYNQHVISDKRMELKNDFLDGANCVWRKDLVISLNGYTENFSIIKDGVSGGEDTELLVRARKNFPNLKVIYDPSVLVLHLTKKKYMNSWNYIKRAWEGGAKSIKIFSLPDQQIVKINLKPILRSWIKTLYILTVGTLFRDTNKYPYYQNYHIEVLSPMVYGLSAQTSLFVDNLRHSKKLANQ